MPDAAIDANAAVPRLRFRLDPVNLARGWSAERRRQYLLRDDIDVPILDRSDGLAVEVLATARAPGNGDPAAIWAPWRARLHAWVYRSSGSGPTSTTLTRFTQDAGIAIDPEAMIAILAWPGDEQDPLAALSSSLESTPMPDLAEWSRLGFDVADHSFVSGLNNCGYESDERTRLAIAWSDA